MLVANKMFILLLLTLQIFQNALCTLNLAYWPRNDVVYVTKPWGRSRFSCEVSTSSDNPQPPILEWWFRGTHINVTEFARKNQNPVWRFYKDGSGATVDQWPPAFNMSIGTYMCVGKNGVNKPVRRKMEVRAISQQEYEKRGGPIASWRIQRPRGLQYVGDNYTLYCNGTSSKPNAGLIVKKWFWGGVPLDKSPVDPWRAHTGYDRYDMKKQFRYKLSGDNTEMRIETFGEMYRVKIDCMVANDVGMMLAGSFELFNQLRPVVIKQIPPLITQGPVDISVNAPEQWVNVSCTATGEPAPLIKWSFNDEPFAETSSPLSFVAMRSGQIKCHATNPTGSDTKASKLTVRPVPYHGMQVKVVNSTSESILLHLEAYYREHDWHPNIPLTHAIIDYRPWKEGGKKASTFQQRKIKLGPRQPSGGWYYNWDGLKPWTHLDFRVRFINKYGIGKPSYTWTRGSSEWAKITEPVWNLTAIPTSNQSFTFTWNDPPTHGPVNVYRIYFAKDKSLPLEKWEKHFSSQGTQSWTFDWRESATSDAWAPVLFYKIQIVGFLNDGPFSETKVFRCSPGAPGYVSNISASTTSARMVHVYWNQTSSPGSGIIGYDVRYSQDDGITLPDDEWQLQFVPDPDVWRADITDLRPARAYKIRVTPRSRHSPGVPSALVRVRTLEAAPTHSPRNLRAEARTSTAIEVMWEAPDKQNQNAPVTKYRVYYTKSESRQPKHKDVTGGKHRLVILGLGKFTKYTVWVTHFNKFGEGPPSKRFQIITDEDAPEGSPRSGQGFVLNSTAVLISWMPPRQLQQGGRIRGYKIYYKWVYERKQFEPDNVFDVPGVDSTSAVVTYDIQPNTDYKFKIAAYTSVGTGPMGNPLYITTPDTKGLSPIMSIELDPRTYTVTLSWIPRTVQNSQYRVVHGKSLRKYGFLTALETQHYPINVRSLNFTKLNRGVWHCFKIAALNGNPKTWSSWDMHWFRMPEARPSGKPSFFRAVTESPESIRLSWELPDPWKRHGEITQYIVEYTERPLKSDGEWIRSVNKLVAQDEHAVVHIIRGLKPSTSYQFRVRAINSIGAGPNTNILVARTNDIILPVVSNLRVVELDSTSAYVEWGQPENTVEFNSESLSHLLSYQCNKTYQDENGQQGTIRINRTSLTLFSMQLRMTELPPATPCYLTVRVRTHDSGMGDKMGLSFVTMNTVPPSVQAPRKLLNNPQGSSMGDVFLHLMPASSVNGPIHHYVLFVVVLGSELRKDENKFATRQFDGNQQMRAKAYQDMMAAQTRARRNTKDINTRISNERVTDHELTANLTMRPDFYIARLFSAGELPTVFQLGTGEAHQGSVNKPLKQGYYYKTFVRAFVRVTNSQGISATYRHIDSPFSYPPILYTGHDIVASDNPQHTQPTGVAGNLTWIIGTVVGVFCLVITSLFVGCRRRRQRAARQVASPKSSPILNKPKDDPTEVHRLKLDSEAMHSHPPIPKEALAQHVQILKANDNVKFIDEFESIDNGERLSCEASLQPANKQRNRYPNVLAYDAGRVQLDFTGALCSDYINANFIDGYCQEHAYIATQGAMKNTVEDLWRMVWEKDVHVIVMMTQLEERGRNKCEMYWPEDEPTVMYGRIRIDRKDIVPLAHCVIRTFQVTRISNSSEPYQPGQQSRIVKQFQFLSWPDPGVPENPAPFLSFIRRVRHHCNLLGSSSCIGPVVVHCSAGVGRTACFIAVDAMLKRIEQESMIDIYGFIAMMRSQRNFMVQTDEQYMFIHDTLVEAIENDYTEISSRDLRKVFRKLQEMPRDHVDSQLEGQFKVIQATLQQQLIEGSLNTVACLPSNESKNKCRTIVPFDANRVVLQTQRSAEGSDYINASHIDGYYEKNAYIAAQAPMHNTVTDFWRMVVERDVSTIVMLTNLRDERSKEQCFEYWPTTKTLKFHYYIIDPVQENRFANFIVREFKLTDARDGRDRSIRQYHFLNWEKTRKPETSQGLIELIGLVHNASTKAELPVILFG